MDDRQVFFRHAGIASLCGSEMLVAALFQAGVAFPVVGDNQSPWLHGVVDESAQRLGATVGHHGKPDAPCIASSLAFVELRACFALANINGRHDQGHVMDSTAFATCPPTNQGLIDFHVLNGAAANAILIWTYHASAELMQDRECGLVTRDPQLSLKLHGGDARCLTGDQIGSPEPDTQRRVAVLHYRSHRQSNVFLALSATQNTWTPRKAIRLALHLTVGADETVAPSCSLQIRSTGPIFRKQPLKLRQRARKRQIVTLENVSSRWMERHLHDCAALAELAQVYM